MNTSTAHQLIEQQVLSAWPDHAAVLAKARPTDVYQCETKEGESALVLILVGEVIGRHIRGYQWMCQMVLDEERAQKFGVAISCAIICRGAV